MAMKNNMFEIKIEDYIEPKYASVGDFHEGLAWVVDRNTLLWGYINRLGEEVISCRFKRAGDFHEGLAVIESDEGFGYIDVTGKMVIKPQFSNARQFSEGLAAVQDKELNWGYIDKTGTFVVEPKYADVADFSDGIGVMNTRNKGYYYKTGLTEFPCRWTNAFSEGYNVMHLNNGSYVIRNTEFNCVYRSTPKQSRVYSSKCGLFRVEDDLGKYGYMNHNLEMQIPCIFKKGEDFNDDVAIVGDDNIIGFIDKMGKLTAFLIGKPFLAIGTFSEGRASALVGEKLGFIDKKGRLVIPCRFRVTHPFSEGLAYVETEDDKGTFIDRKGKTILRLPVTYCSKVTLGRNEPIVLKANTEAELKRLKIEKLQELRKMLVDEINGDIDTAITKVSGDEKSFVMREKK